ncbi:hypothetical protein AX16_009013 [Volvariella volvacea WC 439]|nr:hypothetical protein AX16_009013 [Volvariella volvacea WC 439]
MPQEMTRESDHRALQIPANPTTTISAVGSLYPELLGWIFLFVAQDAYWMYHNYVPQTSHICSYWRSVALQTPRLWNKFYIDSSKFYTHPWTHECLKRTKSVLLDVVIMADDYFNPSKMHEVFPDLCRLESLEVDDGMGESNIDDIQDIFRPYDSTPNPNLRSLSIVCGTGKAYKLPFKLFRNDMPNLEFLVLCNCSLDDWNSLASFNSLTTLAIRGQDPMSLSSFGRLSLLPCLEWLSLDFLQASRSLKTELTPDIERSLLFPALQKLSLLQPASPVL